MGVPLYLIVAVAILLIAVIGYIGFVMMKGKAEKEQKQSNDSTSLSTPTQQTGSGDNTKYIVSKLRPDSTHMDVLLCVATVPENIQLSQQVVDKVEKLREEKLSKEKQKTQSSKKTDVFDIDDGGWAEDEEEDEAVKKAKQEEAERQKAKEELKQATGTGVTPMEGIDEGVLGQHWVETTLSAKKHWPPKDLSFIQDQVYPYKGKNVKPMDHPAVRRNLCMTMGRLHSVILNTHSDLLEAAGNGKIDQTYFKGTMEYRQRAGALLESCLRIAVSLQSYRLAKTIIETVCMFKIGVQDPLNPNTIQWFNSMMLKQYGGPQGLPRLKITDQNISNPDYPEMATGDKVALTMEMDRTHAELFTRVKIAMCQKQGIPPQVGLQTYREGWWILIRAEKLDGGATPTADFSNNTLLDLLDSKDTEKFDEEKDTDRLLSAFPIIVQNINQKSGKVKIQFKAPSVAGKYKFTVGVKSQEFLGADQEFDLTREVVDVTTVSREEKKETEPSDEEPKKDK